MAFAILRTQKLKAAVAVRRSLKHAFRAQNTPNADPARLKENSHLGANSVEEAMAAFQQRLPEKIRKNGVLAIEYLITGSPDGMNSKRRRDQDAYFADALAWLKERHGAENLIYAGIHRDETTPHLYAYVVPLDPQGKLNCRHFLGGAKALSQMQTDFAERVGQRHGLQRGIEGSKARHTTVRQYYAALQQEAPAPLGDLRAGHHAPGAEEGDPDQSPRKPGAGGRTSDRGQPGALCPGPGTGQAHRSSRTTGQGTRRHGAGQGDRTAGAAAAGRGTPPRRNWRRYGALPQSCGPRRPNARSRSAGWRRCRTWYASTGRWPRSPGSPSRRSSRWRMPGRRWTGRR
ncbi:MobV family relaxase [Aeromonas hydrophila]|uniref:MobV family relaxase n=1 Tax=Aeromonas hydrophila TaxID=644 RepID=UPI003C6EBF4D